MAVGEPREAAKSSSVEAAEQEPVYDGMPGQTHLRSIHVPLPNGFVRTVQVYDKVNVGTDPHLREPALAGGLHRFDSGEELAIPFVYHDPHARKLALVVPEVLRHDELRLRAKLLEELAEHTGAAVPGYVREAATVIGVAELASYLETPATSVALGEVVQRQAALVEQQTEIERRKNDLQIQSEALEQREQRLGQRAEQVTRREDELRITGEELEATQADLAMREQELTSRLEMLREREAELAKRGPDSGTHRSEQVRADDVVQLVDDEVEEVEEVQDVDDAEDVEELDELEPLETSPGKLPDDLSDAVELMDEPRALDAERDVEEVVDDIVDDIEELEEVEAVEDVTGVHADVPQQAPLKPQATMISSEIPMPRSEPPPPPSVSEPPRSVPPPPPGPSVAPPPGFLERRHGPEAQAIKEAGGVRIFTRAPEDRDELFATEPPELLAQLVVIDECPVVLLTLVEGSESRPIVLRAALDPRSADDRAVLENLRRKFEARVMLFSADGTFLRAIEVEAPREVNAARILDRVSKMRTAAAVDVSTAIERVLSAPPPVRAKDHPFVPAEDIEPAKNAADAHGRLERLSEWSSHDKMDHALLVLSIPRDRVDGTLRRTIENAVEHGLPLPGGLADRAVSLGVAPDEASLVTRQVEAFAETSKRGDRGGLSPEQLAAAWEALLKTAADNEVAIDTDTHAIAWGAIRAVRGGDGLEDVDLEKLPDMGVPEVSMLLEHPRYRQDAAIELAKRKDPELAETICKSVRKMPRAEVVRVVPRIVEIGDGTGDALIDGLSARKTFVRQAFALALGQLKLRRAVVPLVHCLAAEESDVWRELARVVGTFGTASMRNVTRQLKDPKGLEERYVLTLAHLANHGCAKQVEKLTADERPQVAMMAQQALTLREQARSMDDAVRGLVPLTDNDPILKFSRRFYEELEGKAPEQDLDDN